MRPMCAIGLYSADLEPGDAPGVDLACQRVYEAVQRHGGAAACTERLAYDYTARPGETLARMRWCAHVVRECPTTPDVPPSLLSITGEAMVGTWASYSGMPGDLLIAAVLPEVLATVTMDKLTGLPGRGHVVHRIRNGPPVAAVVIIDLNDLKVVNDTRGHAAGDALICRAAQALRAAARPGDLVVRLGGDEFGIFAVGPAAVTAARVRHRLAEAAVSASVGVASVEDGDVQNAWDLADKLMYVEKEARDERRIPRQWATLAEVARLAELVEEHARERDLQVAAVYDAIREGRTELRANMRWVLGRLGDLGSPES